MGRTGGFLEFDRELPSSRKAEDRKKDYKEIYESFSDKKTIQQAARCMDCGVPFCHNGCPLGNHIPDFNDAVYRKNWKEAYDVLLSTNNFPEFTGRICPAPCEGSCVLGINKPPVAIEHIEKSIAEYAYENNIIKKEIPSTRTEKQVAIIGSGPAGLAAAEQLNKAGHLVTVFERDNKIGGLLRYGIPDFKLEKWVIDRRIKLMEEAGIRFEVNAEVGTNISSDVLLKDFDAVLLCGGCTEPRKINISGNDLKGIYFAMDFLTQQNSRVAKTPVEVENILATDKNVIVIGGGDTGSDCIGTSNRQGAKSILQIELLPKPPSHRNNTNPWPEWPMTLRTSSSHEEGCERQWSINSQRFIGNDKGEVIGLEAVSIENNGGEFKEIEGSKRVIPCDLVLIAAGFVGAKTDGLLEQLGVEMTIRANVKDSNYQTSLEHVFVAGDMRRGQSLVVWAISEGREAARAVDKYLMGETKLPAKTESNYLL